MAVWLGRACCGSIGGHGLRETESDPRPQSVRGIPCDGPCPPPRECPSPKPNRVSGCAREGGSKSVRPHTQSPRPPPVGASTVPSESTRTLPPMSALSHSTAGAQRSRVGRAAGTRAEGRVEGRAEAGDWREENCSAGGGGGGVTRRPIFPTPPPPPSLAAVTGGGVQGGGVRPAVPGGGGQPNIYGSK